MLVAGFVADDVLRSFETRLDEAEVSFMALAKEASASLARVIFADLAEVGRGKEEERCLVLWNFFFWGVFFL